MNGWQKLALVVGVALALAAILHPTYEVVYELRFTQKQADAATDMPSDDTVTMTVRHPVYMAPPDYRSRLADQYLENVSYAVSSSLEVRVLTERLMIEVLGIALATGIVILLLRSRVLQIRNGTGTTMRAS